MATKRKLLVIVSVVVAAAAALGLSPWWMRTTAGNQDSRVQQKLDPETSLAEALRTTGFSPKFVEAFSSVSTQLVSATNGRYHIVQRIPALSLRRDIRIAIHKDKRLTPGPAAAAKTADGFDVYPLHHAMQGYAGGYDRYQTFFVAYDALDAELLQQLDVRRAARRGQWSILPVVHAQTSLLGIVVASVTTTTSDVGGANTYVPPPQAGAELAQTQPGVGPDPARPEMSSVEGRREFYLEENFGGSQEAYTQQHLEAERRLVESMDPETRARLQQKVDLTDAYIKGEIELSNLLREGETLAQQEARVRLERDAARLQRLGSAVAVLGALAEWMQQALDFRDWSRQLDKAEACLDQRAQKAGPAERANIELVRAHLRAARSDMNWNTGVRVANTGNSALGSAMMPAAPGGVLGLASSGNNAGLRDLTAQSLADAIRGVGNCDPPPCPEPPPPAASQSTSTQDHSPGLSRVAPPPPESLICRPAQAQIVVNAKESDGRTITFESIVNLADTSGVGEDFGKRAFRGKGTGPYREHFVSDQCDFTITWTGQMDVEVVARIDEREVDVDISGPVKQAGDWPGESCLGGTYYAPNRPLPPRFSYTCSFDNVDFVRGGRYRGPPPEETPYPYGCTVTIGPLTSETK